MVMNTRKVSGPFHPSEQYSNKNLKTLQITFWMFLGLRKSSMPNLLFTGYGHTLYSCKEQPQSTELSSCVAYETETQGPTQPQMFTSCEVMLSA